MNKRGKLISALLAGAGLMYLLDPDRGARRRALVRDKAVHARHKLGGFGATTRDLRNRARGTLAGLRSRWRQEDVGDEILHERVRSAVGRVVSHPGAIEADVFAGRVTLRGPVLQGELDDLLAAVSQVPGVSEVTNELEVHPSAEHVPSLQGGGRR
jgi:osmotically-inducible protein OsmY